MNCYYKGQVWPVRELATKKGIDYELLRQRVRRSCLVSVGGERVRELKGVEDMIPPCFKCIHSKKCKTEEMACGLYAASTRHDLARSMRANGLSQDRNPTKRIYKRIFG
jgi:hypothetical protein